MPGRKLWYACAESISFFIRLINIQYSLTSISVTGQFSLKFLIIA